MKEKIVFVEWVDALSKDGWINEKEAKRWFKDLDIVCDAGFLLAKTKNYIVLSQSFSGATGQHGYLKKIPRACVKKIIYLKRVKS